jgi:hypothetical protein
MRPGTAGGSLAGQLVRGSRLVGQAVPGVGVSAGGGAEVGVDLAGDVAFELSWSSRCGEKLLAAVS